MIPGLQSASSFVCNQLERRQFLFECRSGKVAEGPPNPAVESRHSVIVRWWPFLLRPYTIVIMRLKLYLYVRILSWVTDRFKREAVCRVNIIGELRTWKRLGDWST